jgi:hypothetical protein
MKDDFGDSKPGSPKTNVSTRPESESHSLSNNSIVRKP